MKRIPVHHSVENQPAVAPVVHLEKCCESVVTTVPGSKCCCG